MLAANYLFAQKMVNKHTTDAEIESMLKANFELFDWQSVYQHHDAVTGT